MSNFASLKMKPFSRHVLPPILACLCSFLFPGVGAVCPNGCSCDDENLHVNCVDANLDIVPITLNPNTQRLILKNNKIRSVDQGLKFYHELSYVDLSHNHLIRIQTGSFTSQRKLVELHMNANKISQLSNGTFGGPQSPMTSLAVLNLQNNLIDNVEPGVFQFTENLAELDLSQNSIKEINISAFFGLSNLRILKLDNNELTQVPDVFSQRTPIPSTAFLIAGNNNNNNNNNGFGGFGNSGSASGGSLLASDPTKFKNGLLPHLAELSLANNQIESVKNDAFSAVKNLVSLDLRGCKISTMESNAFRGLSVLRKLLLTDNKLAHIPTASFPPLIQLEVLKLGRNYFDRAPKYAFGGLKKLKGLEISGAPSFSLIDSEAFSMNLDLEVVELSDCKKLATLPPKLFKGLSGLKTLILKDNALQSLPEDLVSWGSLRSLRLDGNPIRCVCEMFWLKDVLSQPRLKNSSSFLLCAEPRELRDRKFIDLSSNDLNCYLQGPVQKTILGVSIFLAVIFLVVFFFLLYKYHDSVKNACKRGFLRRPALRKNRSSVISSTAKELDTATKSSFLSQTAYPFSDDEFQVRTSLMSASPGPGNSWHHNSHTLNPVTMNSLNYPYGGGSNSHSHNNHSLRYPVNHHHYLHHPTHSANKYSSPSPSYNEYDAPINPVNNPQQYFQQTAPSQIDLPIQFPLHQQHGTLPRTKPIPITEL